MPRKPMTLTPVADFDYDNLDLSVATEQKTAPHESDTASLENRPFTILDIVEEPVENNKYQTSRWRFFIQLRDGTKTSFVLNPSKRRDNLIDQLCHALPVQNMTLKKNSFIDDKQGRFVVYYDLSSHSRFSGTISH